jgi:hypothetical protein
MTSLGVGRIIGEGGRNDEEARSDLVGSGYGYARRGPDANNTAALSTVSSGAASRATKPTAKSIHQSQRRWQLHRDHPRAREDIHQSQRRWQLRRDHPLTRVDLN